MKPNTALIKYKDQPVVNLTQSTGVYVDASMPRVMGYVIRFEFAGGQSTSWTFETREEFQSVYEKICSLFVTDLT